MTDFKIDSCVIQFNNSTPVTLKAFVQVANLSSILNLCAKVGALSLDILVFNPKAFRKNNRMVHIHSFPVIRTIIYKWYIYLPEIFLYIQKFLRTDRQIT